MARLEMKRRYDSTERWPAATLRCSRSVQPEKANGKIEVIPSGRVMEEREEQSSKALSLIEVTPGSTRMFVTLFTFTPRPPFEFLRWRPSYIYVADVWSSCPFFRSFFAPARFIVLLCAWALPGKGKGTDPTKRK